MSLSAQLKQPNGLRVAAAYAVVASLLLQVAAVVLPALMLSASTVTFTTLLLLGFSVAIVIAWAFEVVHNRGAAASAPPTSLYARRLARHPARLLPLPILLVSVAALADEAAAPGVAGTTVTATGYYYAMRDQPDFGVGVAALDHGSWHLETRYNYEAHDATSAFVGWKFAGGDELTFEVTPLIGALFGSARGVIPGLEASVVHRQFDAYVEAELVHDLDEHSSSFFYAWTELAWTPVPWLRLGLVGQRTRIVDTSRDLQRGVFAQVSARNTTFGVYAFNPDADSGFVVATLGISF